jgi:TonB family protein
VALLTLTVLLAGVSAQRFYTLSGSVLDSTNRHLPDTILVLTNAASRAKYEVRSDPTGHFEFVGLPPGDYALEASLTGFSTFKDTITIIARDLEHTIDLHVGSLEETVTVTSSVSAAPSPQPTAEQSDRRQALRKRAEERQQAALDKCTTQPAGAGGIGGQILAPIRLSGVPPQYPENLRMVGMGGVVVLDAVIGTDGNIQDVRAASSPNADLEAAAVEAVRQWQFTPTLLDCVPTEVQMKVTMRFNSQQ